MLEKRLQAPLGSADDEAPFLVVQDFGIAQTPVYHHLGKSPSKDTSPKRESADVDEPVYIGCKGAQSAHNVHRGQVPFDEA